MTIVKGDIIDVNLGNPPSEVKGHEQGFERPCVVIKAISNLNLLIILPCTSKKPKYGNYTVVELLKGVAGLTSNSYALCHQIRTISYDRVSKKRGQLDSRNLLKIQTVLLDTLEL